jgi:chemotaxis protein methyltransferase CheR
MERRLRTYFQRLGLERLAEGFTLVRKDPTQLDALLDRITINVSQLWRNPEQWAALERTWLPELAKSSPRLNAWSAGSSYGAEAYTLAAICRATIPGSSVRILGTDIDRRMVARARNGLFTTEDARTAPPTALQKGFQRVEHGWQARRELKSITRFEQGDLLRITPRSESYDLVLCRNTVIYFAEPVRDQLHARLADSLRPGGCLVIGSTERVANPTAIGLKPVAPFVYRKA